MLASLGWKWTLCVIVLVLAFGWWYGHDMQIKGNDKNLELNIKPKSKPKALPPRDPRAEWMTQRPQFFDPHAKARPVPGEPLRVAVGRKEREPTPWGLPNKSKGEEMCARILANLLGIEFRTYRFDSIRFPETNQPLEIDCYNHEYKIGLEFNGPQHYEWPNWTGQSYEEHLAQTRRDHYKRMRCKELKIRLIEVHYETKKEDLRDFIKSELERMNVHIIES